MSSTSRLNSSRRRIGLGVFALAAAIAGIATLTVAEFRPAHTLGPIAGARPILHAPSRADVEAAHRAFDAFRDQPQADRIDRTAMVVQR